VSGQHDRGIALASAGTLLNRLLGDHACRVASSKRVYAAASTLPIRNASAPVVIPATPTASCFSISGRANGHAAWKPTRFLRGETASSSVRLKTARFRAVVRTAGNESRTAVHRDRRQGIDPHPSRPRSRARAEAFLCVVDCRAGSLTRTDLLARRDTSLFLLRLDVQVFTQRTAIRLRVSESWLLDPTISFRSSSLFPVLQLPFLFLPAVKFLRLSSCASNSRPVC